MKTFTYETFRHPAQYPNNGEMLTWLNKLGEQGWQLVFWNKSAYSGIFMKEI